MADNIIKVRKTGRRVSCSYAGVEYDGWEYEVVECSVAPEKGELIYETSINAKKILAQSGLPSPPDTIRQIGDMKFITDDERMPMIQRGVSIIDVETGKELEPD